MNYAFEIAAVGLQSQQFALDVIANNVANINTPAFRRSDVRFSELVSQIADPENPAANLSPSDSLAGVQARAMLSIDQQGPIDRTNCGLDIAIDGPGFIELLGPQGRSLLWRGGTLQILDDGRLGAEGLPLRASISVPRDAAALEISSDGLITARIGDGVETIELGRIALVRPDEGAPLQRLDGGLYEAPPDASLTEGQPGEDGAGVLIQGAIERSNVDLNEEMIRLLIVQRAYAANAQVAQAADQVAAIANNLRR